MTAYLDFVAPDGIPDATLVTSIAIIDNSGSMESSDFQPTRLLAAVEACLALIKVKRQKRPLDQFGVVTFSDTASVVQAPVSVEYEAKLNRSLQRLETQGGTNFVVGMNLAGDLFAGAKHPRTATRGLLAFLFGTGPMPIPSRTVVNHAVFLSDGHHYGKRSDAVAAARRLKERHGIVLECIGIAGSPRDVDAKLLREMASIGPDGQPRYRFIGDTASLVKDFRRMALQRLH